MKGVFVVNRYYSDEGTEYVRSRLTHELARLGHTLEVAPCPAAVIGENCEAERWSGYDYAVFWDKDVAAARALESGGLRLFNRAHAIETCDDKVKTYLALLGSGASVPKTIVAPLVYDVNSGEDREFIRGVAQSLGYPVVVKAATGSQGRQVWLAACEAELAEISARLAHTPHLYQRYTADERGADIRVMVVGGRAVACCKRRSTTDFRSNVNLGGSAERFSPSASLVSEAERIAGLLGLDYGSVDFLTASGTFVEANSNAYMRAVESLGFDVAGAYARHIVAVTEAEHGSGN